MLKKKISESIESTFPYNKAIGSNTIITPLHTKTNATTGILSWTWKYYLVQDVGFQYYYKSADQNHKSLVFVKYIGLHVYSSFFSFFGHSPRSRVKLFGLSEENSGPSPQLDWIFYLFFRKKINSGSAEPKASLDSFTELLYLLHLRRQINKTNEV